MALSLFLVFFQQRFLLSNLSFSFCISLCVRNVHALKLEPMPHLFVFLSFSQELNGFIVKKTKEMFKQSFIESIHSIYSLHLNETLLNNL